MTFELLEEIIENNNVPKNVKLLSDSGWECGSTDMDGVYYNPSRNEIVFTQEGDCYDNYFKDKNWKPIYRDPAAIEREKEDVLKGILEPHEIIPAWVDEED